MHKVRLVYFVACASGRTSPVLRCTAFAYLPYYSVVADDAEEESQEQPHGEEGADGAEDDLHAAAAGGGGSGADWAGAGPTDALSRAESAMANAAFWSALLRERYEAMRREEEQLLGHEEAAGAGIARRASGMDVERWVPHRVRV